MEPGWEEDAPFAVTVCDAQGIIRRMNRRACETFAKYGGSDLIGRNLLDCHPGASREKLAELLRNPRVNSYTIDKGGIRKLIYQAPVYENGEFAGLVELSLPIPVEMPHFVRG